MAEEEKKKEDIQNITYGVDAEGFFVFKIHSSRSAMETLGFLEQAKDIVKQFYISQHQKKNDQILTPKSGNGFLNRWRK